MKVVYHHRKLGALTVVLAPSNVASHAMVVRDFTTGLDEGHCVVDGNGFDLADVDRIEVIR
jgi:hypothetical protein